MRTVVILLLLANLTLFAYTRLDSFSGGERERLEQQVDPGKIKILSAQEVAALGPGKVESLADVCLEWGPLTDAERARALAELAPLNLGSLLAQRKVDVEGSWSAVLGPFSSRAQAERRLADARGRGVGDGALQDDGRGSFLVAFGVYRAEPLAVARAQALEQLGMTGARAVQRAGTTSQTMIVVRDPATSVVTRLKELQSGYAGTDLRIGSCERTS